MHERVDALAVEERGDLGVDRRLGQIDREEAGLGRALGEGRRLADVEEEDLRVTTVLLETADQLRPEIGAGSGDRDDPRHGTALYLVSWSRGTSVQVETPVLVQLLPDHVIDQIAAGEVVERPASVVKELVENALDAGARMITVEIEGGGRKLVRVVDDGSGMRPADARLALARHATSKLRSVDDLPGLATMGFRGEALPSIAAVSRLVLTTRTREDEAAVRISVDAGRVEAESVVGAPVGTTVEVADLLHNVPARLKFLRGEVTEASHITETVVRLAMAHPEVGFRLRHSGRVAFEVAPAELVVRVRGLLGGRLAERMHLVEHEENGVRVRAFLAAPDLAQTTSRGTSSPYPMVTACKSARSRWSTCRAARST
ncbi:MAG: hypothetical protein F9K40_17105 [Kofleriaceae bacterium]|nr:MAG: hypothetical protein F9K40_17105 [Kofleriaceae bacterium]